MKQEAMFLLDRLEEYDPEDEDHVRDFHGHIAPAIARLRNALAGPQWDMFSNRSYPPVEKRAAEIYAAMEHHGPGTKPEWLPSGNSQKQDEARYLARRELLAAGHVPDSNGDRA